MRKKILFICPKFHEYEKRIIDKLVKLGNDVVYQPDFSDDKIYFFLKATKLKKLLDFYVDYVLSKKKDELNAPLYDLVLVIKGEGIPQGFWQKLKGNYEEKTCRFIMYQWDSLKNYNYGHLIPYFDQMYTFDYEDAELLKSKGVKSGYLALFYDDEIVKKPRGNDEYFYDFAFIGALTVSRYTWLNRFKSIANARNYKVYTYLYLPLVVYLYSLLKGRYYNFKMVSFSSINLKDVLEIYKMSRVIIDLNSASQSGLTMRTLEVIGSGCKLITTNKNISKESFYNPNNVLIIDAENVDWYGEIKAFVETPYLDVNVTDYSLSCWVNSILR